MQRHAFYLRGGGPRCTFTLRYLTPLYNVSTYMHFGYKHNGVDIWLLIAIIWYQTWRHVTLPVYGPGLPNYNISLTTLLRQVLQPKLKQKVGTKKGGIHFNKFSKFNFNKVFLLLKSNLGNHKSGEIYERDLLIFVIKLLFQGSVSKRVKLDPFAMSPTPVYLFIYISVCQWAASHELWTARHLETDYVLKKRFLTRYSKR